jgi:hypothetical protein
LAAKTIAEEKVDPFHRLPAAPCGDFGIQSLDLIKRVHFDVAAHMIRNAVMHLVERRRISLPEGFNSAGNQVRHPPRVQDESSASFAEKTPPDLEYILMSHKTAIADAYGLCDH